MAWRRRAEREFAVEHRPIVAPNSPFAALAALQGEPRARATSAPPTPDRQGVSEGEACRADVWLWRARFFKTRALARPTFVDEGPHPPDPDRPGEPARQARAA